MKRLNELNKNNRGFTLLELLVAIAILAVLTTLMFGAFNQASKAWLQEENRVETFQQARAALDYISKELSQAIVTTNIPFAASSNSLAFVAPVGNGAIDGMDLKEVVYRLSLFRGAADPGGLFVDQDSDWPKKLIRRCSSFSYSPGDCWDYGQGKSCSQPWDIYTNPGTWMESSSSSQTVVLAENIMSINYTFFDSALTPTAVWNSIGNPAVSVWPNELPSALSPATALMSYHAPVGVQITIGAIDTRAATRLKAVPYNSLAWQSITNQATRFFTTYVAIPNRQL